MSYIKDPRYIGISIAFLIIAGLYATKLYIEIQKHNLNTITEIRQCYKDFNEEGAKGCTAQVKRTYIPYWKPLQN